MRYRNPRSWKATVTKSNWRSSVSSAFFTHSLTALHTSRRTTTNPAEPYCPSMPTIPTSYPTFAVLFSYLTLLTRNSCPWSTSFGPIFVKCWWAPPIRKPSWPSYVTDLNVRILRRILSTRQVRSRIRQSCCSKSVWGVCRCLAYKFKLPLAY